jgi:RNA polymerase sigma-54 factor
MRMDQRQVLTPRMIQSMEILQLPLMALEERIEQELQANPVLELQEPEADPMHARELAEEHADASSRFSEDERALVVKEGGDGAEDFNRLDRLADYLDSEEFSTNGGSRDFSRAGSGAFEGERDKKLDAMANTAGRSGNLSEHLLNQWAFIEAPDPIKAAGEAIINYIEDTGYLRTDLDEIRKASRNPLAIEDLTEALRLVQTLEPAGIGARDIRECLLLQLDAIEDDEELSEGHDLDLERTLVRDHLKDLEMNRYPQISKKLGREIDEIKTAVRRLGRLSPHPGKQIGRDDAPPITPDAVIYLNEETGKYDIEMANDPVQGLSVSQMYQKMMKDKTADKSTREFLADKVRNAKWLLEAIEQRKSTIHRVIRAVVDAQQEFFEKGPESLKPLPMIGVADQLGIHVATVSRAVSEKWIQTPRGVFPLRRFFSGGTTNEAGEDMSWDAVKEKLKIIIDNEDKKNPLNDDEIVERLKGQGIDLARRTVAKYRKILNIPTARQRRDF